MSRASAPANPFFVEFVFHPGFFRRLLTRAATRPPILKKQNTWQSRAPNPTPPEGGPRQPRCEPSEPRRHNRKTKYAAKPRAVCIRTSRRDTQELCIRARVNSRHKRRPIFKKSSTRRSRAEHLPPVFNDGGKSGLAAASALRPAGSQKRSRGAPRGVSLLPEELGTNQSSGVVCGGISLSTAFLHSN